MIYPEAAQLTANEDLRSPISMIPVQLQLHILHADASRLAVLRRRAIPPREIPALLRLVRPAPQSAEPVNALLRDRVDTEAPADIPLMRGGPRSSFPTEDEEDMRRGIYVYLSPTVVRIDPQEGGDGFDTAWIAIQSAIMGSNLLYRMMDEKGDSLL